MLRKSSIAEVFHAYQTIYIISDIQLSWLSKFSATFFKLIMAVLHGSLLSMPMQLIAQKDSSLKCHVLSRIFKP